MIAEYKPMTALQLGYLLLAGLSATGGQYTITAAYIYAPARDISVYDYSQIVFSSLLGLFVFGSGTGYFKYYRLRYHNSHGGRNVLFKPQISKKRITRSTYQKAQGLFQ